jgi:flavin-binding protein dodecin
MENETQPNEEAPLVPPAVSQAASALGRRGRGRAKTITDEDRQRRSDQMKEINAKRVVRIQGVVVNGPRGNTTIPQTVKTPLIQPVTNPAIVDSINRASQTPPPWQGQKVARVQGRRVE